MIESAIAITVLIAGASKLMDLHRFESILRQHSWLRARMIPFLARVIPALEVSLGSLVLVGFAAPIPLIGLVSLLILFTIALGASVLRGTTGLVCGCFGGLAVDPVDSRFVTRNILLIAAGASAVILGSADFRMFGAATFNGAIHAVLVDLVALSVVVLVLNVKALRALAARPMDLESGADHEP